MYFILYNNILICDGKLTSTYICLVKYLICYEYLYNIIILIQAICAYLVNLSKNLIYVYSNECCVASKHLNNRDYIISRNEICTYDIFLIECELYLKKQYLSGGSLLAKATNLRARDCGFESCTMHYGRESAAYSLF